MTMMRIRKGLGAVLAGVLAASAFGGAAAAATTIGFDPNFGISLGGGDEGGAQVVLPFAVSLFGQSFSTMNISTNGYVTLTNLTGIDGRDLSGDSYTPNVAGFLGEQARITPEWFDWESSFYYSTDSDRVMVTWVGNQYGHSDVSHTAQLQVFADGRIVFAYDDPTGPTGEALAGITTGGGVADPGSSSFLDAAFSVNGPQAIYSFGDPFANNVAVTFTPDGNGGYGVTGSVPPLPDPVNGGGNPSPVPEPAAWALMLIGFGGLGAMLRLGRRRAVHA
jgi:hypothetical protein